MSSLAQIMALHVIIMHRIYFDEGNSLYFDSNVLKHNPDYPMDNTSAMVQLMACQLLSAKPLAEPVMTWFSGVHESQGLCVVTQ